MTNHFDLILAHTEQVIEQKKYLNIKDIKVKVTSTIKDHFLVIHYHISVPNELIDTIQWQSPNGDKGMFTDYLWTETCLECFIGSTEVPIYVEINACPNHNYAVYKFTHYRIPDCIPPKALIYNVLISDIPDNQLNNDYHKNNEKKAQVSIMSLTDSSTQTTDLIQSINTADFQTTVTFDTRQLPKELNNYDLINFAVILFFNSDDNSTDDSTNDSIPLYFSHSHPRTPDFHNQSHWVQPSF